ncbi:hypothetical protein COX08_04055 [Candidatus Beckwithbacteria bacterium CG23_combo_of_CG06-09_8_20_14_all_34_8]|uniref:GH18 domain-containing protein n=1 Tax=Candidatus Beckwithbacteria bacterium CG23_combo_of_CG06-09_8_20_14_all_34_8 TaxID=1974497 RepID=A0A2H0B5D8_9BACT|nr:MAG: hypothetical protein COX08_04055 [Candidatus Beckwithbacteria bacterium CG23_combo_of_CG06-09_8_20_14_all_34_8]
MYKIDKKFAIPLVLGIFLGFISLYLFNIFIKKDNFLSPLGNNPQILAAKVPSKKPIIGFLPYWNLNTASIPLHLIDYLAYFSVTFNPDGTIKKMDEGNLEIGWYKLGSDEMKQLFELADKQDVGRMITFTAFNNEIIDTLIGSSKTSQKTIDSIITLVKQYQLDGVNIDFEYHTGYPISKSPQYYVDFIDKLRQELDKQNLEDVIISLDLYANAFINNNYYDSVKLSQVCDWVVLMGYDFYQTSSSNAGPVAPLKNPNGKSITQALDSVLKNGIKTNNIILAMPFYGYEWQTIDDSYNSATYPGSGAMASYKRVMSLIKDQDVKIQWDNQAMSPWLSYNDNGNIQQIYYENDQSIGYKLQLITQLQLQGAAIWALGYEGSDATVWNVIEQWRKNQN